MELKDFVGQPCKSRIAFEFVPKKKQQFNLLELAARLRASDVFVEMETPYLLILKVLGYNVSLFRSGKIVVKDTNDRETAKKAALALVKLV